jgi:hypothetical protein
MNHNKLVCLSILFMKIFLTAYFTVAKAKAKAVPLHAMEALEGERRYSSYSLSTLALDGGEWSVSRPGEMTPSTHCIGGWVGPRASLDTQARGKILLPLLGIEP